jgi:TolB-like protein
MELLSGESLQERLKRGALPLSEVLALGRGTLSALAALHDARVVHRDLKPSNVFLTPHGVKLLDFGLARPLPRQLTEQVSRDTELTRPGLIVGTPRYMAPEQVTGQEVDARTDLFTAAAILYEAAAGRPAFLGATVVELLSATLHEEPPALAGDAAVAAFDRVLRRALAKRPESRPSSAAEMLAELEAVRPDSGAAGAAVARPLTRLAVLPFRLLRPDPEIDFLAFSLADAVAGSLSGLPSLVIRSSAAVARFATEAADLRALATQADVDVALVGTLLRAGDQIRATAQLVETPSGTLVSSQTLQSPVGDLFQLQDELSRRIVESLSPSLGAREGERRRGAPASARAYEFYLRGNQVQRDFSQVAVARDLYRQCLDEDSGFAPAWARLGRTHRLLAKYFLERPAENLARAEECFRRALELDPELPLAHKLFAHHEAESGRAREAMLQLLGLARRYPNDPELFAGLVHACRYSGLLEASEAAHREVRRLDPHHWTSVIYTFWLRGEHQRIVDETTDLTDFELRALALLALGREHDARRALEPAKVLSPVFGQVRDGLRALLEGREEGLPALRSIVALHTDPEALYVYACVQARFGEPHEALATLQRSIERGYCPAQALRREQWLEGVHGLAGFEALRARADAGRHEALAAFRDAAGDQVLGAAALPAS